jgi:hypothetical protein
MQRCPKCYRTYENDNQKYCTACGGRLVPDAEIPTSYGLEDSGAGYTAPRIESAPLSGFDPNQTAPPSGQIIPKPDFDPNRTVANAPPPPVVDGMETIAISRQELSVPPPEPEAPAVAPTVALSSAALTQPTESLEEEPLGEVAPPEILEPEIIETPEPPVIVASPVEMPPEPEVEEFTPVPEPPFTRPATEATIYQFQDLVEPEAAAPAPPEPPLPEPVFPTVAVAGEQLSPRDLAEARFEPETPVSPTLEPDTEGVETASEFPPYNTEPTEPEPVAPPPPSVPAEPPAAPTAAAASAGGGKSRLPLILGILAALGLVGAAGLTAAYFFAVKPYFENKQRAAAQPTPEPTPNASATPDTPVANATPSPAADATPQTDAGPQVVPPPPNAVEFVNNKTKFRGKLADNFIDFTFYYPKSWKLSPPDKSFFAEVRRSSGGSIPQEDFSISWYPSKGTFALDEPGFAALIESKNAELMKRLGKYNYQKLGEGPTKINGLDAYELRYQFLYKDVGIEPINYWGRVIYIPAGVEGQKSGVAMYLTATSKAGEIKTIDDVGEKGELPIVLNHFRFTKPQ